MQKCSSSVLPLNSSLLNHLVDILEGLGRFPLTNAGHFEHFGVPLKTFK